MIKAHSFHIPVMGIGFTMDTPLKVAMFGIDSVISLVDDILLEKLREMYCRRYELPYSEITTDVEDFRAKRITAYLNLIQSLTQNKFAELKDLAIEKGNKLWDYFDMLPDNSRLKTEFDKFIRESLSFREASKWINDNLSMGSIDVNIMTKIDRENYRDGKKLPTEYNDAHAAIRGYANSDLNSSVILSAGMNPRLYGYIGKFNCFFPDEAGKVEKRIVLKVSDFRSAMIQGKFLAKKGLWVSEYRIESGLNCGGHAFATDGHLLGPILAYFRDRREELISSVHTVLVDALSKMDRPVPKDRMPVCISAQGGVGTSEEHQFLIDHYRIDSVGWGTPFLLVPEVTTVDAVTRNKLVEAKEDDLYLSNISPLGVPFNNLRGNTKDIEKLARVEKGIPGSSCPKKYVTVNKEFTETGICTASRQFQDLKLKELNKKSISPEQYRTEYEKIVEKSCICVGLGTAVLLENDLDTRKVGDGVSICPGPNLAYFSKIMSLKEMTDHIYGRSNVMSRRDRPHMFVKELQIYLNYFANKVLESSSTVSAKQRKYLTIFADNLREGIQYYYKLYNDLEVTFGEARLEILRQLDLNSRMLDLLNLEIEKLSVRVTN
ncbi:MAG: hypothetical protein OEQ53_11035 [Saprospiraceae bacterium]|nr:hypothetical protein [Saprospiraceae bacterium]